MESISLEPHGSLNRIWGIDGKRKWIMDAGKASKKCLLQDLSVYILSLLSSDGGIYLPHIHNL